MDIAKNINRKILIYSEPIFRIENFNEKNGLKLEEDRFTMVKKNSTQNIATIHTTLQLAQIIKAFNEKIPPNSLGSLK